MRLVSTREATRLTELSTEQLREWTTRRALIPADVQSRGRGAPAQYAWQTLLVLRIAAALRDRFHIELEHHRPVFAALRDQFSKTSFVGLWGRAVAIYDADRWEILAGGSSPPAAEPAIVVRLDPHLTALSQGLALAGPTGDGQFELFPAIRIDGRARGLPATAIVSEPQAAAQPRRRA